MAVKKEKSLALADKHISKQNFNKALNELLKVEKVAPNDVNLLNKIGDLYSKLDKRPEAIKYFTKVADNYQRGGFSLKAIAVYKKVIRIDERQMEARDRIVALYMQQGHQSEVRGELRRMAEIYHADNLFARALACYEKLIKVDPGNLDARIKITELLLREGRRRDAAEHFVAMARDLVEKNMLAEAQKVVSRGLKVEPGNLELQVILAKTALAEGKTDEAIAKLTEICRKKGDHKDALKILGRAYLDRGQLRDANACFLRVLHLDPQETGAVEEVATAFTEAGQLDDAFQTYTHLAERFLEVEEPDEAIRVFRGILYKDENHIPSLEMMVRIYESTNQTANAVLYQEKIIHYYKVRGDQDKVIGEIQRLLELDPEHKEWKARLEAMAGPSSDSGPHALEPEADVPDDEAIELQDLSLMVDSGEIAASSISEVVASGTQEEVDQDTRIANLLTDAEMALKYGLEEQAIQHLAEIKDLDHLHVRANLLLKKIYLDSNQVDRAVGCMVSLVNAYIEREHYNDAQKIIEEVGRYRPDIAGLHRERLNALTGQAPATEDVSIMLDAENPEEVVDFRDLDEKPKKNPTEPTVTEGEPWSLDMDSSEDDQSFALDFDVQLDDERPGKGLDLIDTPEESGFDLDTELETDLDTNETNVDTLDTGLQDQPMLAQFMKESQGVQSGQDLEAKSETPSPQAEAPPPPDNEAQSTEIMAQPAVPEEDEPEKTSEPKGEPKEKVLEFFEDADQELELTGTQETPALTAGTRTDLDSLSSELEEIDFFISVEAFEDARALIKEASARFDDHPLLMERLHEIEDKTQAIGRRKLEEELQSGEDQETDAILDQKGGFFDLAAELTDEIFGDDESGIVNDKAANEDIQSVEELFEEFKKGVDEQIDDADHQTHYDLGIAYKEMGLLEEAILEFEKAKRDPSRYLECITMIGSCLIELGRPSQFAEIIQDALQQESLDEESQMILNYELGRAFEDLGETEKALEAFMLVKQLNPGYRDLSDRIEALV